MTLNDWVPQPGQWPVDPQEDQPISKDRIWLDGCFDFSHHGEDKGYPVGAEQQTNTKKVTLALCYKLDDWALSF